MKEAEEKYHLYLKGIKPVKTPVGRMWNFGDYKGKSSMRYFEFVGFANHVHIGHDEIFYVLGGRGKLDVHSIIPSRDRVPRFLLGEKLYDKKVSKGSLIYIQKGEAHSLAVPTGLTLDTILIIKPEYDSKDEFPVKVRKL